MESSEGKARAGFVRFAQFPGSFLGNLGHTIHAHYTKLLEPCSLRVMRVDRFYFSTAG
jgi:hypothetical protein